jgi:hypothetical protein
VLVLILACTARPHGNTDGGTCAEVCPPGTRCNGFACVTGWFRCSLPEHCAAGEACVERHCVAAATQCLDDGDCTSPLVCDYNTCSEPDECSDEPDCDPGHLCESRRCEEDPDHPPCTDSSDCDDDQFCSDDDVCEDR